MSQPRFTVDTHLFSELGELLVGRDSTALNELVKNSYDADASTVVVHGEGLRSDGGSIVVWDDGIGMTDSTFQDGFLRIATRAKSVGDRRSPLYGRRYTGRKGIGRLAAHKLASQVFIRSIPCPKVFGPNASQISANIDWDIIERCSSLDESAVGIAIDESNVHVDEPGTTIELRQLRRKWTESMLSRFVGEVQSFEIPDFLTQPISNNVAPFPLLFDNPIVRDSTAEDPGFKVALSGDFDIGDDYWNELAQRAQWIIEIEALRGFSSVSYAITPTTAEIRQLPSASAENWRFPHPNPDIGPFFSARIFVRSRRRIPRSLQAFARGASGIRLFMEGFRVLPYGERGDDWLRLDADYTRRREPFELGGMEGQVLAEPVEEETLFRLANNNYYGGVFLTESNSTMLKMLVNREGFLPDEGFDDLKNMIRRGIDLSVRLRASAAYVDKRRTKSTRDPAKDVRPTALSTIGQALEAALETISESPKPSNLDHDEQTDKEGRDLEQAAGSIRSAIEILSEARSEQTTLRVAASIGTQLAAFVHEMNILLGQARAVYMASERVSGDAGLPRSARSTLRELRDAIGSLVEQLERQVSFLTEVVGVNARRRRRRLPVREQVEVALRLLSSRIERKNQSILIDVPLDLRTPPMFGSELLGIIVNVLSNGVKAAGDNGAILIQGTKTNEALVLEVANTGEEIDLTDAERWFLPFESTTAEIDEVLGQGMGLGLPIVLRLLAEYGGSAQFIPSRPPYKTTIHITIPDRSR